jgi:hypothetical protein
MAAEVGARFRVIDPAAQRGLRTLAGALLVMPCLVLEARTKLERALELARCLA